MRALGRAGFIVPVLFTVLLWSCDRGRIYDTYYNTGAHGWHADSLKIFTFDIDNASRHHDIFLNIRNDRSYRYSNLWLFVKIIPPEGETLTDTIQVVLADHAGRWMGKGLTGIYHTKIPYRTNVYFPMQGSYAIQVQHGMRTDLLEGITNVGFRVEKRKN
jgi:gliding motility-associated lipoprotein GldH